ncbi:epoxyqueuosine reductase QueH [Campylobacter sp. RM12920]|uniref:Epoxyqueuosine reductase QueH n=1 Tax=Campylobacter californiensis TaxID=1032243 RepID=A0ABD4JJ88_9BACT|nr:epoxyqueuosine reductase QueH [Campylobacter sp. RM12919]MBE2988486.1 epoxyqueuosine reductase QueH [Campylobacter sp. RM12920]
MLVHICCSVDSHYFLRRLRADFSNERLIGYFYDPNIHPYSEYVMRFLDVKRSCDQMGIELIVGEYDYEAWLSGTKGLENEPEKGKRCVYCFEFRVGNSAKKAVELGEKSITTTLLMSPKKDFIQLENALNNAVRGYDLTAVAIDYRKNGGTNEQFELAKKDKLYHQNYCGCVFGLSKQREAQKLPVSELMSEINGRILPGSIGERLKLYERVRECESSGVKFHLSRKYFLNYRLLRAYVKFNNSILPSFFFLYSNFKRENVKFSLNETAEICDELRDGVTLLSLKRFNKLSKKNYKNVIEICKHPLDINDELSLRREICGDFSQNPIIILDEIHAGRYEIYAKNVTYNDSREILSLE